MRKFTLTVLAVLFVVATAAPAMATDARVQSMAGVSRYIEDDYNIFVWPATLASYSNMVWIGLGNYYYDYYPELAQPSSTNTYLGVSYGLGSENKYGTLAMFLYHYGYGLNPLGSDAWPGSGVFDWSLDNKWTIMWAYPMEKFAFGLYFNRSDNGYKHDDETPADSYENHAAYTTIGGSIRFDIGEKAYADLGASVGLASYKYEQDSGYGNINENANMRIDLAGRMFYQWNETVTLVPFIGFTNFDFSLKADSADYTEDYFGDKAMMIDIGIGANVKVNEDNLLVFAFEPYSYMKRQPSDMPTGYDVSYTTTVMPRIMLALESDVKDWLTFRVGAYKEFIKDKEDVEYSGPPATKSVNTETWANYDFFMGVGFHIGDFDIDALLNNDLPFRLGYWLTGYQPYEYESWSDAPAYMITGTYHF